MLKKIMFAVLLCYVITESYFGATTFALFSPTVHVQILGDTPLASSPEFQEYTQQDSSNKQDRDLHIVQPYSKSIDYSDYKIVHADMDIENHNWIRSMRDVQVALKPANSNDYLYYTNEAVLIDIHRRSTNTYGLSIAMSSEAYSKFVNHQLPATLSLSWGHGNTKEFHLNEL